MSHHHNKVSDSIFVLEFIDEWNLCTPLIGKSYIDFYFEGQEDCQW